MISLPDAPENRLQAATKRLPTLRFSRLLRWVLCLIAAFWLYQNWHRDLPMNRLAQRYAFPESRFVTVDDMQVHYRMVGQGEPILLLHDANSSLHTWSHWTTELSAHYQVISVDLPGFGLTGPHPRGSYSAFMYANFLEQLARQLNLSNFHLVGNGLGAQVAWFYAAEYPVRVRKLVLLDAPGFESKGTNLVNLLARTPVLNRTIWHITPQNFIRLMLSDVYADDALVTDSLVQRHFELLLRPGNRKAFTDHAAVMHNRPPVNIIDKITVPTLILWGAEDTRISPEYAYEFHRRIHGSVLRVYQNTGHWPQEENPVQTAQDVRAFLEGKF